MNSLLIGDALSHEKPSLCQKPTVNESKMQKVLEKHKPVSNCITGENSFENNIRTALQHIHGYPYITIDTNTKFNNEIMI